MDISKLNHSRRWVVLILTVSVVATVALLVAGTVSAKSKKATKAPLVAVLWPENVTPRWEGSDNKVFIKTIKKLVPGVKVLSLNAGNKPATQQAQAEGALAKGAKVIVVAAVDGKAFASTVDKAWKQKVPVIAYDRLIYSKNLEYYVSFDSVKVGKVEAGWMATHTPHGANIAIINGSTTDANAHFVKTGIHQVYDPLFASKAAVNVGEQWGGWDPPTAQSETEQILTQNSNKVDGVISANDGMAGGIIAALKSQHLEGKVPTTGQDASFEGIQNIIQGYQGVSAFKDFRLQAPAAARIAAALLTHKKVPGINGTIKVGSKKIPSWYGPVVPVTKGNLSLLVNNGWIATQAGGLLKVCTGMPKVSICS